MCGIGGPRTGQTHQHECRAVRGEVSAGCRKDLCLRSWKGHCREGRLWEDRGQPVESDSPSRVAAA